MCCLGQFLSISKMFFHCFVTHSHKFILPVIYFIIEVFLKVMLKFHLSHSRQPNTLYHLFLWAEGIVTPLVTAVSHAATLVHWHICAKWIVAMKYGTDHKGPQSFRLSCSILQNVSWSVGPVKYFALEQHNHTSTDRSCTNLITQKHDKFANNYFTIQLCTLPQCSLLGFKACCFWSFWVTVITSWWLLDDVSGILEWNALWFPLIIL